jgi:catechol 2,3-dioxygenase-like lactoylglutathione lyase family enzyme
MVRRAVSCGLDYWIWPGRLAGLGSSLSDLSVVYLLARRLLCCGRLPLVTGRQKRMACGYGPPRSACPAAGFVRRTGRPGRITGVSVQLNHTIVACHDQQRSAAFLTGILGLPPATRFGPFLVVEADNGVSLDFAQTSQEIASQHYAFLVGEEEFDAAFGRIRDQDLPYWADPGKTQHGAVNHRDGGRGLYFEDPNDHLLEIITRPYGSG